MPDPAEMQAGPGSAPGGAMPPGGAPSPGTGSSPATMPVANRGIQAAAMARLGNVIQMLHMIAAALGPGNEGSHEVTKAITSLSKVVPPGSQSAGLMQADLQKLAMEHRQQQMNAMAMRNQGGGQQAAPPPPPPAQMAA